MLAHAGLCIAAEEVNGGLDAGFGGRAVSEHCVHQGEAAEGCLEQFLGSLGEHGVNVCGTVLAGIEVWHIDAEGDDLRANAGR